MYWINRIFADGTESDYRDSANFESSHHARAAAIRATAQPAPGVDGGECYVILNGTAIAHYREGQEEADISTPELFEGE